MQIIEYYNNYYHILKILVWDYWQSEPLVNILYFCKYLYYRLFISFWLIDFRVIEKLLEDQIYYFLPNFNADTLEFVLYFLEIRKIHNIKSNLVTNAFSDDFLYYIYYYIIFFEFFYPKAKVFMGLSRFY